MQSTLSSMLVFVLSLALHGVVADTNTNTTAAISVLEQYIVYHHQQLQLIMAQLTAMSLRVQNLEAARRARLENVALYRPTFQSSNQFAEGSGLPFFAVDGNSDTNGHHGSCSQTKAELGKRSWWQVDLEGRYNVSAVIVVNVQDTSERLRNVDVAVFEEDPRSNTAAASRLCLHVTDTMKTGVNVVGCSSVVTGRYLRITNAVNEPLTLCEVQVLAVPAAV